MAYTVANLIAFVEKEIRQLLDDTNDATLLIQFAEFIVKDLERTGPYNIGLINTGFSLTAGTSTLTLADANSRRIRSVFDATTQRPLIPLAQAFLPTSSGNTVHKGEDAPDTSQDMHPAWPKWYIHYNGDKLDILPPPKVTATTACTVVREKATTALITSSGTSIGLPDEAIYLIVAGLNWISFLYLDRPKDAEYWAQIYAAGKNERGKV